MGTKVALAVVGAGVVTMIYDKVPMTDGTRRRVKDALWLAGPAALIYLWVA